MIRILAFTSMPSSCHTKFILPARFCFKLTTLTHKVLHHGRVVVGRGSQAQELLTAGHRRVVDGLHVDVVPLQQDVAHLGVELSVAHLSKPSQDGEIRG